jgi:uncharacterized protein involved in exopolysaccharide biosynthesis
VKTSPESTTPDSSGPRPAIAWGKMVLPTLLFTLLGGGAGAAAWVMLPVKYRSNATFEVTSREFRTEGVAETQENAGALPYRSVAAVASFKSSLLAARVAEKLGAPFTTEGVRKNVSAKSADVALIYVSADADKPETAQRLLQMVVEKRLEQEQENFNLVMKPLVEGIDRQLGQIQKSITDTYQQIAANAVGKSDTQDRSISGSGQVTIEGNIAQLVAATEAARIRLAKLNSAVAEIESGKTSAERFQDFGEGSQTFADLKRQLAAKMEELASLSSRYGTTHPKVVEAQAAVAETKRQLVQGLRELAHQAETNFSGLQASRELLEKNLQTLKTQTFTTLDRDPVNNALVFANTSLQAVYQQLLGRRNQLAVTLQMKPQSLRLLDPPDLPQGPYQTTKLMALAGALAAGGCIGLALGALRAGLLSYLLPPP